MATLALALLLVAGLNSVSAQGQPDEDSATVDVRVWQHLRVSDRIYVTALPRAGSRDDRETVRVLLDDGQSRDGVYRYGVVALAAVEVRVWQRVDDPSDIRISARPMGAAIDTVGPVSLLLDDGFSTGGGYRYGQVRITVPAVAAGDTPVVAVSPGGDEVPRLAALTMSFGHAPTELDAAEHVMISPAIEGSFVWADERTLFFQPAFPGWQSGQQYVVSVSGDVLDLEADHVHTLTAEGRLTVAYVIPGDGDIEVPANAQILVQFNRSVAPLTLLQEVSGPPVLEFDPPLAGEGEWLNTALYRFVPSDLQRSTEYSVRIPARLTSADHGVLEAGYSWSFTTTQPAITSITPHDGALRVELDSPIVITFNEPMNRASVQAGVVLRKEHQTALSSSFAWNEDSTTLTVTPADPLSLSTRYEVVARDGLLSATGGTTRSEQMATFRSITPPFLQQTDPYDAKTEVYPYDIALYYNNPMDVESFAGRVSISGIAPEQIILSRYTGQGDTTVRFDVDFEYSTTYTVRIAEGVRDLGGRTLPASEFSFTTREVWLPPTVVFLAPASLSTFSAGREQMLDYYVRNAGEVRFQLFRLSDAEAETLLRRGFIDERWDRGPFWPKGRPLRQWTKRINNNQQDELQELSTSLSGGGRPLPVGHYFLAATPRRLLVDREPEDYQEKLVFSVVDTAIVTKLAHDELLVWAVDYDTGEPLAETAVRAARMERAPLSVYELASTDSDGLARFAVTPDEESWRAPYGHYLVRIDEGQRHGVAATWWQFGISLSGLDVPTGAYFPDTAGHLFTDRPIYRPGETVFYRGVARHEDDASYSIPGSEATFALRVRDPQFGDLLSTQIQLSDLGTFGGEIALPANAATGSYTILLSDERGRNVANVRFTVAEFRVPEFEVEVGAAKTDYIAGELIATEAQASFYFGGPVVDAAAEWTAQVWPTVFRVEGYEDYSFWDREIPYWARTDWQRLRGQGQTRTDASGVARFEVPAELKPDESTHEFTISTTVTDASGQAVAESTTVTVHPANWYVGIKPESYVATSGEPASVHLVTADFERRIAPNRPVTVRVYKREWVRKTERFYYVGAYYLSEPVDTEVDVQTITTGEDGEAAIEFTPPSAGTYRLVAESVDDEGRVARSARFIWATGTGYAGWPVRDDDVIQLIADRECYDVGEVAEVLVPAPYAGATGLVTIERGGVLSSEVRRFETTSEVLRIPIEDQYIPDVYVGVVLYRPPTDDDPSPRYHVGYARLRISTAPRQLNVSIQPERDEAQPGETVQYEVQVTAADGRGLEAEVTVAVVDQAVLSLLEESGLDGLGAFWSDRALGVRTASSLTVSIERGDAEYRDAERTGPLIRTDAEGVEQEASYPESGGGPTAESEPPIPRFDFRQTALWIEELTTDALGRASFQLQLPDNTTTWNARARAVTAETQVGEGESELLVTKPLLIRPALPRFLRVGDEVELRTLVTNRSTDASDVTVTIETEGLALDEADARDVEIEPGGTEVLSWSARALEQGIATIRFIATVPGREGDAVEHTIPVHPAVTPETTATGGVVEDTPVLEALYLPDYAITDSGSLEVSLQASLVGTLDAELRHFKPQPRESSVRIASRIVALIAVQRASASGLTDAQQIQLGADVRTLFRGQRYDGGWSWCRSCHSTNLWVSGWVLIGLGEAADAGYSIPEQQYVRAVRLVTNHLNRDTDIAEPPDPNQHAFLLYALNSVAHSNGDLAGLQADAMHALVADHRQRLNNWGRAYVLLGLTSAGVRASHDSVRTLLNDLTAVRIASANGNHWESPNVRGSMHNGSVRTTALVLRALAKVDPRHALIEETVRWLVVARSQERWKTSVERSQGMASLSVFAQFTGEGRGVYDYQVLLNSQRLLDGDFDVPSGDDRDATTVTLDLIPQGEVSRLQFDRDSTSEGRMYYALNLRYQTPAKDIAALNRGFAVSRQYSLLEEPDRAITSATLGAVLRVEVTVVAPADRRFARVEDFLPAGLEPIDPQLSIVSPWLREQLQTDQREALLRGSPSYSAPWFGWYVSPWGQVDIRDDRITLLAGRLPSGVHHYVYYARATTPGDFFVLPAHAEETYFPEVFGRSDSGRFSVRSSE